MNKSKPVFLLLMAVLFVVSSCEKASQKADFVVNNASIWTGNENQSTAEAMAVLGDSILAIGTMSDVSEFIGDNTEVLDLSGKYVYPGFIDSHVHFLTGGFNLNSVLLRDAQTPEEFVKRIEDYASTLPEGSWILGGDWDHQNWGGELPTKEWIDAVTPDNPVFITRLDGHMSLANSLALDMAGVTKETPDIDGGEIVRNSDGEPTGIFKDNATDLIWPHVSEPSIAEHENALKAAMAYVASKGVTSVQDMLAAGYYNILRSMRDRGDLITRIYAVYPLGQWEALLDEIEGNGSGDEWLKIGGLKGFVDGSLGSHTAAFFNAYDDAPADSGFFVTPMDTLYSDISAADRAGLQVMIHAIGDKAINNLLNTYERVENENGPRDRRFRIEHAQHIAPEDIPRFANLKVIPSMQPYHAIDDGRWAENLIGSRRAETSYAFNSLLEEGAMLAFGSDWFVAPPTPLDGIYAAVTRRTLDGNNAGGWVPEQKITAEQALIAYTRNAAYASFEEDIKGTLEKGKLADFVVLGEDLLTIDPTRIRELQIESTYVGGKKVYTSGSE